jgi:signal transduction histidine kinase
MAYVIEGHWRLFRQPLSDYRFWMVQALGLGIVMVHTILEARDTLSTAPDLYLLPVSTYLLPVVYAGLKFGLAGALPTALWLMLLTIPELYLFHQGMQRIGVAVQLAIILALGLVIAQRVDRERRAKLAIEAANLRLMNVQKSLQGYIRLALRAHEEERVRLARELHDETIQDLLVVKAAVEEAPEEPGTRLDLAVINATLERIIDGIRRFCRALRPSLLDDLGLVPAVEWLLSDLGDRSEIRIALELEGERVRLDAESELAIFRIAQEALRNVERHAQAHQVNLSLVYGQAGLRLEVFDDGRGFDPEQVPEGSLGLTGMQERARLIGADFHVSSRPGSTRVVLHLPLGTQDGGPADDLPDAQNQAVESAAGANAHRGIDEPGPAVSR